MPKAAKVQSTGIQRFLVSGLEFMLLKFKFDGFYHKYINGGFAFSPTG